MAWSKAEKKEAYPRRKNQRTLVLSLKISKVTRNLLAAEDFAELLPLVSSLRGLKLKILRYQMHVQLHSRHTPRCCQLTIL